jgi:hypothetical protein
MPRRSFTNSPVIFFGIGLGVSGSTVAGGAVGTRGVDGNRSRSRSAKKS